MPRPSFDRREPRSDRPPAPPSRPAGRWAGGGGKPAPAGSEGWQRPWVQLKYFTYHPHVYDRFIGAVSSDARPGDLVAVYDRNGDAFGTGLFHPTARVTLRVLQHGAADAREETMDALVDRAVDLRERLGLGVAAAADDSTFPATDAYRVIHSDGDGLSGLTVDRYGDVLSVEVHSLGIWRRLPRIRQRLDARLGTKRMVVNVDPVIARMEQIRIADVPSDAVGKVKVRENGVRFEVNFESGHKTGFFTDQRENRARLAGWSKGRRVLDLCCYTGGFAVAAAVAGADEVTAVDLDEASIEQAKRNGHLNRVRFKATHADAFSWLRQVVQNGERWPLVVLDPPKLIFRGDGEDGAEGRKKYEDFNTLALQAVEPGGLFVTCSCSGLLPEEEFERIIVRAAHRLGRRLQFIDRTEAGPDHPVMSNCPESRYLKVYWCIVP